MSTPTVHHRSCPLCEAMCGIRVEVEGGQIRDIRGDADDPLSRGHICPKAHALKDLHEDPDRLRTPLIRRGGRLVPASVEEAIAEIARRLAEVERAHGRDALGVYLGNPTVHVLGAMLSSPLLLAALGTKNRYSATSVDQLPHMFAALQLFGHQLLMPIPDIDRTAHMLILGANPLASNGSIMTAPGVRQRLDAIVARGGQVVVVDPRRTETAKRASRHHFIRPGTDALLLLCLAREIFESGRARPERLELPLRGLEALRAAVAPYPPERVAARTGIEAEALRRMARELLDAESAVVYGRMGASTQAFGGLCAFLINAINILTGNLDRPGGAMFTLPAVDFVGATRGVGFAKGSFDRYRSRVRGLPEFGGELPVATLADEILTPGPGQLRALLTVAGNPALSSPNGARLEAALPGLDFMACVDPYLNETTRHADVIIPPSRPLEKAHYDVVFHLLAVRDTAKLSLPIFDAPPGSLDDGEILARLVVALEAARGRPRSAVAFAARGALAAGPTRLIDGLLRAGPHGLRRGRGGLSAEALLAAPSGVDLGPLRPRLARRLPWGRRHVELAPPTVLGDLPRLERELTQPPPALTLIGRRQPRSNNSWLHNAPSMMRGRDRCTLLIHPRDAARLGLADGALARVRSRVGELRATAELCEELMPGVVSLPHGFGHSRPDTQLRVAAARPGVSINDLTDETRVDALTGTAAFTGLPVEVSAASPTEQTTPPGAHPRRDA